MPHDCIPKYFYFLIPQLPAPINDNLTPNLQKKPMPFLEPKDARLLSSALGDLQTELARPESERFAAATSFKEILARIFEQFRPILIPMLTSFLLQTHLEKLDAELRRLAAKTKT